MPPVACQYSLVRVLCEKPPLQHTASCMAFREDNDLHHKDKAPVESPAVVTTSLCLNWGGCRRRSPCLGPTGTGVQILKKRWMPRHQVRDARATNHCKSQHMPEDNVCSSGCGRRFRATRSAKIMLTMKNSTMPVSPRTVDAMCRFISSYMLACLDYP